MYSTRSRSSTNSGRLSLEGRKEATRVVDGDLGIWGEVGERSFGESGGDLAKCPVEGDLGTFPFGTSRLLKD